MPNQLVLGFQAQPPRRGARGDDHSPRFRPLAFDVEAERPRRKIRIEHRAVDILRAEVLRLPLHVLDQLRTVDTFREAGKILHQRGHRELPARFVATNHDWFQIRTRRVNSRRIPRAPRTDDDNIPHKDFDEKFSVPQAAVGRACFSLPGMLHVAINSRCAQLPTHPHSPLPQIPSTHCPHSPYTLCPRSGHRTCPPSCATVRSGSKLFWAARSFGPTGPPWARLAHFLSMVFIVFNNLALRRGTDLSHESRPGDGRAHLRLQPLKAFPPAVVSRGGRKARALAAAPLTFRVYRAVNLLVMDTTLP